MYKYDNNILPSAYDFYVFCFNQSVNNNPNRQSNEFNFPLLRTLLARQDTSIYDGPKIWNALDIDIKPIHPML